MDNTYKKLNIIIGWIIFLLATAVYLVTMEPTASFWDCGEYIATAYKLQVGHPPGAPFFQILGRLFSMFVSTDKVGMMINSISALSSSFTILFLFWSITAIAKKLALKSGEFTTSKAYAVLGSGAVGALAYTFSDSFWFSAVEGEVYAMSSFFTALVFWAILKWESVADEKHAVRWIVFIAYMIGLSIGVHLLNLLAIPAIVFIYYFKKHKTSRNGILIAGFVSIALLGLVQNGIIPGIVSLAAKFELFFVNTVGLPFNSGTIIYLLLIIGLVVFGLQYSHKKGKALLNTAILSFVVLIIGYSSFFILVIRSQANPPIDENNPENAISLLSYLNREQYGDWPLAYGQYFNAPLDKDDPTDDGKPVYAKDSEKGIYVISDARKGTEYNYDKRFMTPFPRMYSSSQSSHAIGYKAWGDVKGKPVTVINRSSGEQEIIMKPTFGENLKYFIRYQVGYMYWRYFLWNFAGRQNDNQGQTGNVIDGNWYSGISFIDSLFLGDQSQLPESLTRNKAMNKFYFLPLILGLIGLIYHAKKNAPDALVVFLIFFFTGMAIVLYLNQTPYQPRERDYAYAGSFYGFAIWIGLGVYALYDFIARKMAGSLTAVLTTVACLLLVPGIMAKEGWDDHDRSNRFTARDFAKNYLASCAPNAILFTNGDNDTFPLWYVQEVEGYRTDVRVVNLSLLSTDWYIDQMKRKAYDSDAVPFSLTHDQYRQGTRDYLLKYERAKIEGHVDVREIVKFITSEAPQAKVQLQGDRDANYLPTGKFKVAVDTAALIAEGLISPDQSALLKPYVEWQINKSVIMKSEMMILDLLANNNWKRPIYFAITTGNDAYMGLQEYFQLEGLAYRLMPFKQITGDGQTGKVNTEKMYDNLMNKFQWGGMENPEIWMDENNLRMTMNFRNNFYRLADALLKEGKKDKAKEVLDRALEVMPETTVPYNYFILPFAELYYKLGETEKANLLIDRVTEIFIQDVTFYASLKETYAKTISSEIQQGLQVLKQTLYYLVSNKQTEKFESLKARINELPMGKSNVYNSHRMKVFAES